MLSGCPRSVSRYATRSCLVLDVSHAVANSGELNAPRQESVEEHLGQCALATSLGALEEDDLGLLLLLVLTAARRDALEDSRPRRRQLQTRKRRLRACDLDRELLAVGSTAAEEDETYELP